MITLITKFFAPVIIGIAIGVGGVVAIQKATRQEIKLECPAPIVNLKCPDAVNTIDFDKIKGFKGNITLDQNYHVEMNGDSLILKKISEDIARQLKELRLARCK